MGNENAQMLGYAPDAPDAGSRNGVWGMEKTYFFD